MKTSEFKCPLHYNNSAIITLVQTHIDDWQHFICAECNNVKKDIDKIDSWLRDSNSKLDGFLKKKIKEKPLIYFEGNQFDYLSNDELHQSVYKVVYYQNNILLQHLYQCGFKTLKWRIFYWTQKSCYTYNIDDYTGDKIPLWLLDDENLIKANYNKKQWTL